VSALSGFTGRWALVTGAGDGIGRALALGFAQAGLKLIASDIRADAAESVAAEARAVGVEARGLALDVSDRAACLAAADTLTQSGAAPALVWANAGVGLGASVLSAKPNGLEWLYGVNLFGVIWTAQAFAPGLLAMTGARHFGVTASSASLTDVEGPWTIYAASKQATAGIAEALAAELPPQGVGVTILYPGLLNTNIWNAARARPERFGGARELPPETGDYWRAAPGPDVLVKPVLATIASGGGRCWVDPLQGSQARFEARVEKIRAALID
jgi:NAD(P)-dependent dehydrogenase (short-subunit alcohol dehydrogenase family)